MLNFRSISLSDKTIFHDFEYISSDYIFSYLYMYGDTYKLKIWDDDRTVIIRACGNKPVYYMPLGDTEYGVRYIIEHNLKAGVKPVFCKIPYSYVSLFESLNFKIKEDRNSFDYIFRNSELAEFENKEFRKQRNNLSNFLKGSNPYFTQDIYNHIEECCKFTVEYYDKADVVKPTLRILDALNSFQCIGGIVWNQGEIQAFCIYEKVSPDTLLAHVELTNNSHRGVHAYLIKEVSSTIKEEYINKEDDMGLQGLRRFKESYNPCSMLKKYTASLE